MSLARNIGDLPNGDDAPVFACRAWINFNGTGTIAIRDSGNVTSITDNGTGDYTVTYTTAMPDANYCVTTSTGGNVLGVSGHAPANGHTLATGSMRVTCGTTSANVDPSFVHFSVFR